MNALKNDNDKVRMELLPEMALVEVAKVFTFGSKKYGDMNYMKGMEWSRLIGAVRRHTSAFLLREDNDPESGIPHLAHAVAGLLMLLEYQKRALGTDNRVLNKEKWDPFKEEN